MAAKYLHLRYRYHSGQLGHLADLEEDPLSATKTILALTRHTGGVYYGELLSGVTRTVTHRDGRVVIAQTLPADRVLTQLDLELAMSVAGDQVDAVVGVSLGADREFLENLIAFGKPVVLTSQFTPGIDAPVALPDNQGGIRAGVEHLLAHGHTRIGFVGDIGGACYGERHVAFQEAMRERGLPGDVLFAATDWSERGGDRAAEAILACGDRPTAVIAASGHNAIGLIRTLTAAGVAIPEDIAILGFDNLEAGIYATPSLSCVNQRFDDEGALAGRLVMDILDGIDVPPGAHVSTASVVMPRGSCGCRNDLFKTDDPRDVPGVPVLPSELEQMMHNLLDRREHGAFTSDSTAGITQEFERLLSAGDDLSDSQVRDLVATMRRIAPRDSSLHEITSVLTEHVQRLMSAGDVSGVQSDPVVLSRIAAELWRVQNFGAVQQSHSLADHAIASSKVAVALLSGDAHAARSLSWLEPTHVQAGMLALWDDDSPDATMRISGIYDPLGRLNHAVGEATDIRSFPPADFIAGGDQRGVCFVLPVDSENRRRGLLAVLGEISTEPIQEAYQQWSQLLANVLEGEELQRNARASEERYIRLARASNDGLWEIDLITGSLYMSPRCEDILGGLTSADGGSDSWIAAVHPEDRAGMVESFTGAASHLDAPVDIEYRIMTTDGGYRWVLSRGLAVSGEDGTVVRLVGSITDIHPRKELEEQLRQGALYDVLTGLPNRRLFHERLTASVEQHHRDPCSGFAVVFLDLDGFKLVNDSLGHLMGDELLKTVATRLRTTLRAVDTAARFGGDEFAVLLCEPQPDEILVVARRIQEAISAPLQLAGHEVAVTASVGITTSESAYANAEDVLRDADIAMYEAKSIERGAASVFDPYMHVRATGRLRARGELRTALARDEFVVHYQPIVALDGSGLAHFEALVRWQHPERGLLLPGEFLPAMEDNSTIVTLGRWIIEETCRQIAEWQTTYTGPITVSVNLSHREFWSPGLLHTITDALLRHSLAPRNLILEITESVIMADPHTARQVMTALHDLGIRLHVDDFGTGQSSLNALRTFPVDALKIDGAFIRELTLVDQTTDLVRIIVEMGKTLGLDVVAECVETSEQAQHLRTIGCANAQGWFYAKALPGPEAAALLGTHMATEHRLPVG